MTNTPISVRSALIGDVARLTEIAFLAKRFWGYPEAWIQQWAEELTIKPAHIDDYQFLVAEIGNEVIGFCAVAGICPEWEIEHFWVDPGWMGKGVGKCLFNRAMGTIRAQGGGSVRILSDPHAVEFYVKMAAVKVRDVPSSIPNRTLPELRLTIDPEERSSTVLSK